MSRELMNVNALGILSNLVSHFRSSIDLMSVQSVWSAECPIGIEVEVKWRDYFPQLWDEYLADTSYQELSSDKKHELTSRCAALEEFLLPRLKATAACGIEKGADKYWEFAFPPVTDVYILADQVNILKTEGLIPAGSHSLHVTVGGLHASRYSYYMLLLLEMLSCDANRIASAYHATNSKLSATWARKGLGGIYQKDAGDLQYGFSQAIELRTLALSNEMDVAKLLQTVSIISDTIHCIKHGRESDVTRAWKCFVDQAQQVLDEYGLDDTNWKKPNITQEYWDVYIDNFESIRGRVLMAYVETFDMYIQHKTDLSETCSPNA